LRPRDALPSQAWLIVAIRRLTGVALSLLLTLSSLPVAPAAVFAAPPDPGAKTEAGDPKSGEEPSDGDDGEHERLSRLPDTLIDKEEQKDSASSKRAVRGWPGFESIRRRGLEAPFDLRQPKPVAPVEEEADKGDGEPRQERLSSKLEKSDSESEKDEARKQESRPRDQDIRIWPMRADSYSFTQPFGCVPQIANFYFAGENCPPSAPVIHSGVDLAAPEGVPFYAAASGWVTGSGYDREVGVPNTRIIIQHDGRNEGFATEYLHWIASFVEVGDYVEAGEQIGEVGSVGYSTGPHLHFSVVELESGEHVDPVRWLPDEPGSQGYRGIRPDSRARMRLPAGTTAGLPESADPAPPPPPEREDVPESPPQGDKDKGDKGKDRSGGKRKRHRDERRAEKENQAERASEESDTPETVTEDSVKDGKNKERTRKRERNKDGQQEERAANGKDGGKRKSDDTGSDNSGDKEKKRGRHENGNGNGNGHRDDNSDDKVKQRKTDDRDRNDRDKPIDNGGDAGSGGDDGSKGDKDDGGDTGAATPDDSGRTDDGGDTTDDQSSEDNADNGSEGNGNGDVKQSDGETTAERPADDSATEPVKNPKRREES
jgi:murein DD-endopeptidase MepM/ murein hydrolase activator NlpD